MVTTTNRVTRSRVRRLETIFDDVGAQHAATPHTPQLPAPATAAAREVLDKCKQLARDNFDRKVAKTVATKILGDKSERFAGTEADAVDIFSQLMHELRAQFVLQSSAFAPLFDLTDMAVEARHEANELLLSALTFLARPGSPARDWLEASGSDVPGDGKRAALEVVRMLQERSEPFDSFELLLAVRIPSSKDPDRGIREFNGLLRDVRRSHNLPEDAVKRQFLKALGDSWLYRDLANSLARADQRQGVSLLTIQARVREQFRHGLKVSDAPVSALSFGDGASDLAAALSSLQKQLERMQQDIRDLKRQKREGPPPAGKHLTRSAAKLHRAGVKPLGTAPHVSFDKKSGAFVPHCQNARFYDAGDEHAFESLCTMEGRPEVVELSAHSFVPAEPTSLRHFQDAAASAQDAAADDDGVAHFPLATFHSGARGSIPPPPAVRDPSALVAGGAWLSPESPSIGLLEVSLLRIRHLALWTSVIGRLTIEFFCLFLQGSNHHGNLLVRVLQLICLLLWNRLAHLGLVVCNGATFKFRIPEVLKEGHHTFFIDVSRGQAARGFTSALALMFKKMGYAAASISFQEKKIVGKGENTPEKKANTTKSKLMTVSKAVVLGCPPKWDLGAMAMQGWKTVRCFGVPGSTATDGKRDVNVTIYSTNMHCQGYAGPILEHPNRASSDPAESFVNISFATAEALSARQESDFHKSFSELHRRVNITKDMVAAIQAYKDEARLAKKGGARVMVPPPPRPAPPANPTSAPSLQTSVVP
ncbi:hypothetical protein CYMTET_45446 [Cymbomonas tetramitiformis]|uniref:Uncharacterized protein n=1 Tax=Cymbomonas tetramitiformis TaxID=36881 RepID=A0AAE0BY77_9CHLO|nr:hypothetical protein CYMTET_45446 [Cymbomonas tetramitiformis]